MSHRKRPVTAFRRETPITQVLGAARTGKPPTAFRLLDLADEIIAVILKKASDCSALVRLSQTCRSLCRAARDEAVWKPILLEFFDGTLPPVLAADT